jgi:predicted nucleic acid-binding protein
VTVHLDTSFLIGALLPGSDGDRKLRRWLRTGTHVALSAIAWAEFLCGPLDSDQAALASRLVSEILPFTPTDGETAADLFNQSGRRRGTLADCMIAAVAIRAQAELATANREDFRSLVSCGLRLAAD